MITVEHLTKCYGDFLAVDDLSFEIEEGHVYGFLGPNGAGKSTTMNIITGCLSATEGHVRIDGYDIFEEPLKAKRFIGYLPEQPPLYMNETPLEYLQFVGEAKGLRREELKMQIEEVVQQTRIEDVKHRRIAALSKGYKQRVGIAQALLGNPKVIILDEPTVGLDPIQIIEIRDLIKELGKTHTVIFSSHILSEVQAICDQILIINKGKLVAYDTAENLEKQNVTVSEITLKTDANPEKVQTILDGIERISDVRMNLKEDNFVEVTLITEHDNVYEVSKAISMAFALQGEAILEMNSKKANLEDVFLELTNVPDEVDVEEDESEYDEDFDDADNDYGEESEAKEE